MVSHRERLLGSNGWQEWFSREWALQELIAPSNVKFLGNACSIDDQLRTLARTLSNIWNSEAYIDTWT